MAYASVAMATTWMSLAVAALVAQGAPAQGTPAPAIEVVATTSLCADLARAACEGAKGVRIRPLMGPGVDPHLYRPTVSDVRALAESDVVVANGLMLEGRMEDLWPRLRRRGTQVICIADGLLDAGTEQDPHVWMDAALWAKAVERASERLAGAAGPDRDLILAAGARTAARWRALDGQVRAAIASIPPERRLLVTAHDAFGHFGRAYGIDVRGVQGLSTESETGLADLRALVDEIVGRKVPAVFRETSVPDRAMQAVVEAAASRGHRLATGRALHSDALGAPGTGADTYEGMMRHNVRAIVEALGGDPSLMPLADAGAEPAP